jgi:hypothetical protein
MAERTAGGGGFPRLYQNADFLTADFGCVTQKIVRAQN